MRQFNEGDDSSGLRAVATGGGGGAAALTSSFLVRLTDWVDFAAASSGGNTTNVANAFKNSGDNIK